MTNTKHTPLRVELGSDYIAAIFEGPRKIAQCQNTATASKFVRAVNAHDELVDALKYCYGRLRYKENVAGTDEEGWKLAQAALAKAEGK